MTNKPFGNYCHKHGKGMFNRCQDCIDELVALGIQADKDRIAELERENERLREWQPIETAPKDGARVLACRAGFCPQTACYVSTIECSGWVPFDIDDVDMLEVWIEHGYRYEPTHWMPLLEPPK